MIALPATGPGLVRWRFGVTIGLLSALAALTLMWWGTSPLAAMLERAPPWVRWPGHIVFLVDWLAMCVAMMLPTAVPVLAQLGRIGARAGRRFLPVIAAAGFLGVWFGFGVGLRPTAVGLASVDAIADLIAANQRAALGTGFMAAGLYMLSPITGRCDALPLADEPDRNGLDRTPPAARCGACEAALWSHLLWLLLGRRWPCSR